MKKAISILSAFMGIAICTTAQIPNNGFENWTNMGTYLNPDSWGTMNNTTASSAIFTATKGTPGNPGSSYLKLTSKTVGPAVVNGIAVSGVLDSITLLPKSGFQFILRPQSFTGSWQHMIYGSSQGSVSVLLTRWNTGSVQRDTVATANQTLSGMAMSWANFTINFTYQSGYFPDTCIIVLKASGTNPTQNDYLWVDNLAFSGTVAGVEENAEQYFSVKVFPNPAIASITIETQKSAEIEILNIQGQIIKSINAINNSKTIDISALASGMYFVKAKTEKGIVVKKFVKE